MTRDVEMSALMSQAPARAVAIINPATRGNVERVVELLHIATPRSTQLDIYYTEFGGHATDLAKRHAPVADLLIAIGGDGTVAEVAGATRNTPISLGIVPVGSTNIIARELGIPAKTHQATKLLFEDHEIRAIDSGVCGDRTFLHMAGAGVDSMLFDLARPELKRRVGWLAYLPAALEALRRPMSCYNVTSSEVQLIGVRSPLVLVANGSSIIAPRLQLDSRIKFDDGRFDVMVVTATNPVELANVFARIAMRRMGDSPHVVRFTTTDVEIESTPHIPFQLDGDIAGTTPARFTIDPASVRIVVPRR